MMPSNGGNEVCSRGNLIPRGFTGRANSQAWDGGKKTFDSASLSQKCQSDSLEQQNINIQCNLKYIHILFVCDKLRQQHETFSHKDTMTYSNGLKKQYQQPGAFLEIDFAYYPRAYVDFL